MSTTTHGAIERIQGFLEDYHVAHREKMAALIEEANTVTKQHDMDRAEQRIADAVDELCEEVYGLEAQVEELEKEIATLRAALEAKVPT